MHYVLLIDDNDATAMIACPTAETADAVGAAAIFNDGDVSAYKVPGGAFTDYETVIAMLRNGASCDDIHEAGLPSAPRIDGENQ